MGNKILKFLKTNAVGFFLTLASIVVVSLAHWVGIFDILELKSYDYRFANVRGPLTGWSARDSTYIKRGTNVVLVEVDDEAWRLMPEAWPYPRGTVWGRIVRNLSLAGAKVICFDIQFDSPEMKSDYLRQFAEESGDTTLKKIIPEHGDVILGKEIAAARERGTTVILSTKLVKEPNRVPPEYIAQPVPDIMAGHPETGLINDMLDADQFSRQYNIFGYLDYQPDKVYLTLGMKAVKAYLGIPDTAVPHFDPENLTWHYGPLDILSYGKVNNFLTNYYGPPSGYKLPEEFHVPAWGTFPRYSVAYVIDNADIQLRDPEEDIDWMDQFIPGQIPDWIQAIEDPEERQQMMDLMGLGASFDITKSPFYNKIVIIGVAVEVIHDTKSTPFYNYMGRQQLTPGMETHANAIQTMLDQNWIRVFGGRVTDLFYEYPMSHSYLIALLAFIALLLLLLANPIIAGILILLEGLTYFAIVAGVFTQDLLWFPKMILSRILPKSFVAAHHAALTAHLPGPGESLVLPLVAPLAGMILTYTSIVIYRYVNEQKDKKFLKSTFGAYISPELIDQMYEQKQEPKLGGDSGIKTAYFTDIQSFSSFSELLTAAQLVELLNEYLTVMTDVLLQEGGTLDKYEGDAIVAFFGAPLPMEDHAYRACLTALGMQRELGRLRKKWEEEGEKWPELVHNMRMRIGINSGEIVTGNMGSRTRMNYTMMGDVVNTAARLEASGKQYGIYIQVTKETLELAGWEKFAYREIDKVRVVGKSEAVETYELLGERGQLTEQQEEMIARYQEGMEHYRSQRWGEAIRCFEQSEALEEVFPKRPTTPSRVYLERCRHFQANPPGEDWDGIWVLTSK
ncbi:MAG: adenylate/guanylate cyclase domain-containing protein [Candidatus Neomarinimicrobiota bacterium]|nr:MAG: adenylate/guanylate cyclase domain-containing protein [Candidatus Neomarinimicrobiota bacterium]